MESKFWKSNRLKFSLVFKNSCGMRL